MAFYKEDAHPVGILLTGDKFPNQSFT